MSCRRSFWWLLMPNIEDSPEVQIWEAAEVDYYFLLCLCFYCLKCLDVVAVIWFVIAQFSLHEAFSVRWSPAIKELHEKRSQICANHSISQSKAKWVIQTLTPNQTSCWLRHFHILCVSVSFTVKNMFWTLLSKFPTYIERDWGTGMTAYSCSPFFFCCLKKAHPSVSRENLLISRYLWVKQKYLSCTPNRLV